MAIEYDRDPDEFFETCVANGTFPNNDALKQIVLERIAGDLEVGETYEKSEINETIRAYYDDFVLPRRELHNFGYVTHDNTAGTYTVRKTELSEDDFRDISRLERHAQDLGILD